MSFLLLALFMACRMDVAVFARIRCIGNIVVIRSRPCGNARSRATSGVVIVTRFTSFRSLRISIRCSFAPRHPVLFAMRVPRDVPIATKARLRIVSLQTPPTRLTWG